MAKDTVIELAKTSRKALKAVRHRLDSLQDVQQHQGDQLARIERTIGTTEARQTSGLAGVFAGLAEGITGPKSIMGELGAIRSVQENHQSALLNQLRDIKSAVRPDSATAAGVLAKLDRVVPEVQGINASLGKVRSDLIGAVRDLTGTVKYLRTDVGAVLDRQAEGYDLLKSVRADVGTIRSTVAILEDNQGSGQMRPALAEVRDGLKQLRLDLVDVAAEQADDLGQRIDAVRFELTNQLAGIIAAQGSGNPAVLRGRLEDAIKMLADLAKSHQLAREESNHYAATTRNKVESWLGLLSAQGDMLQSQHTQLGILADRVGTLLDRQERLADRDAGYQAELVKRQSATHENGQAAWAEAKRHEGECESRHQSIIAYLKVLERKLDALSVEVADVRKAQEES